MSRQQSYPDKVMLRLLELLNELPKAEQALEMLECEKAAFRSGYLNSTPRRDSAFVFSADMFNDLGMKMLASKDSRHRNALGAKTPSELILNLLPSDGHLE